MTKVQTVTCQECGWKGTVAHCEPIAPRYLPERVAVGDVMPAGECPECGANAMLDEQRQRMADLRPEMEALMLDFRPAPSKYLFGQAARPHRCLCQAARGFRPQGAGGRAACSPPSATPAAAPAFASTHGLAGTRAGSAGNCTPPARQSPSARIATSSAATR